MLENNLAKSKSGWLVGNKCTYVDLSFYMWDETIDTILAPFDDEWDADKFRRYSSINYPS